MARDELSRLTKSFKSEKFGSIRGQKATEDLKIFEFQKISNTQTHNNEKSFPPKKNNEKRS